MKNMNRYLALVALIISLISAKVKTTQIVMN